MTGRACCVLLWCLALTGCVSDAREIPSVNEPVPDFSGYWEVDYARSDSVQNQLNAAFREVQREIRRRNEAAERGTPYQGLPLGNVDQLIALAQMAELVTDSALIEVMQDTEFIRFERENSFALRCRITRASQTVSSLGSEMCWWDGEQWHFWIQLPDGLTIKHRFSRAADGQLLSQRTLVGATQTTQTFEVGRIFARYEPGQRGYHCTETLSRGKVCTTERAGAPSS